MALMKLAYLAIRNLSKAWDKPINNWALAAQQLAVKF
jgi:putative transposase